MEIQAKTPNQIEYIRAISENDIIFCDGPAGSGKAQPLDAIVYTPTGPKQMGEMQFGDTVCTPDGGTEVVMGVFPQGKIPIYKVTFSDNTSTECCGQHLWYTETCLDRDAKRKGSVKTTNEIKATLFNGEKRNHAIPMTKEVEFEKQPCKIPPYLLGVILGDGCIQESHISVSTADDFIEQEVAKYLEELDMKIGSKKYVSFYCIKNKKNKGQSQLLEELEKLGLKETKSYNKYVPDLYKYNNKEVRLAVLQGLMDTDGTINKRTVSYTSTSYKLAEDVKFLVESLGGKATVSTRQTSYTHKGIKQKGRVSYRLFISMPSHIIPFRLPRKKDIFPVRTKYPPKRYIQSVDYIGEKEAQCILISGKDHLYMTNNFIVTHNTLLAIKYFYDHLEDYTEFLISRSIVCFGKDVGTLPGNLDEKTDQFFLAHKQYLSQFSKQIKNRSILKGTKTTFRPIEMMQGHTYHNTYAIFDEAQNFTPEQIKMAITRMGRNSKVVIIGDSTQSTKYNAMENGLKFCVDHFQNVSPCEVVKLDYCDILRNPKIANVIKVFDDNNI